MSHHERVTFSSGSEAIEHGIRYLTWLRDALEDLGGRDHDLRVKMLLDSVTVEQRNLLGAIERFLEDAPDKALRTYAQYAVELPAQIEPAPEPLDSLALIQWLERHNQYLQSMFAELSKRGDAGEAADMFAGIAQQIESHDRRLSKEYQRSQDL